MTIWRMRIVCCITKNTNTTLTMCNTYCLALLERLHERVSMLRNNQLSILLLNSLLCLQLHINYAHTDSYTYYTI
jgi:hypothetical protein